MVHPGVVPNVIVSMDVKSVTIEVDINKKNYK